MGCFKKIRQIPISWDEKNNLTLILWDIFRPKVALFFSFVETSLKNLSQKSMKIIVFNIFFLGSNPASMLNQKNLSKVQYLFILILKKLPRFSKNIPIIKDNSHPAAFVPYGSYYINGKLTLMGKDKAFDQEVTH